MSRSDNVFEGDHEHGYFLTPGVTWIALKHVQIYNVGVTVGQYPRQKCVQCGASVRRVNALNDVVQELWMDLWRSHRR
jgi:hypothetical protein